jgi:uncharacterized protein YutE (UPF0331/DUF86 family)
MTPRALDPEVVQQKLSHIARLRQDLLTMGAMDASRLQAEPVTRHAGEWILTQVAQLAAASASYLVVRSGDPVPATYREAFRLLAAGRLIESELAERLQALAGMRNLLVHRYDDIDLTLLADGLRRLPDDADAFVRQLTIEVRRLLGEDTAAPPS